MGDKSRRKKPKYSGASGEKTSWRILLLFNLQSYLNNGRYSLMNAAETKIAKFMNRGKNM